MHLIATRLKCNMNLIILQYNLINLTIRITYIMIDRFRQIAIFARVIDYGSFRGAARDLNLSPSVVSHHVSQLEEHLGVALIYRSTRRLKLTNEGNRLIAATRKMIETVDDELQQLSEAAKEPSGELRITFPSVLSSLPISEKISAFSLKYPRIILTIDFSDTRRTLIGDGFDLAIRIGQSAKNSATTRKLFTVKRVLVASTDYLANRAEVVDPKETLDWEWLALVPVHNLPLKLQNIASGETIKIKPTAHIFTNDAQALYRLACAGAGLAVVPEFLEAPYIQDGTM